MELVFGVLVLPRVGDEDPATDRLDPERRIAVGQTRIDEGRAGGDQAPRAVPHVHATVVEVGRVEPRPSCRVGYREALVDRTGHRAPGRGHLCRAGAGPSADLAVLTGKEEPRRLASRHREGRATGDVEDRPGRAALDDD